MDGWRFGRRDPVPNVKGQEVERGTREKKTYPNVEIKILVCDAFDIKPYCWYRRDDFSNLLSFSIPSSYHSSSIIPHISGNWKWHTFNLYSNVVFPALSCNSLLVISPHIFTAERHKPILKSKSESPSSQRASPTTNSYSHPS
jgi:hypothetical protein